MLNSSAARLLFPDGNALGHDVIFPGGPFQDGRLQNGRPRAQVIGVVADSKYSNLRQDDPPMLYLAAMQGLLPGAALNILIRTSGPVLPLLAAARTIAKDSIPDVPLPAATSMEQTIAGSLATERVMSALALFFGALSISITAIGLYGTLTYSMERRTGEIGIRLALGAERRHIMAALSAEVGLVTALGCLVGLVGSYLQRRESPVCCMASLYTIQLSWLLPPACCFSLQQLLP